MYRCLPAGYRQSKVFTEACDAGMCCDWSPGGALFAAAFQDGVAAVWDHRSGRVVAHYQQARAPDRVLCVLCPALPARDAGQA